MHHANIERSCQSSIVTPKYNALCGMAKCYVMNPLNGMMHQIRVLLDSGANLSFINNDVAKKIGCPTKLIRLEWFPSWDLNSTMLRMSSCLISTRNSKTTTRMRCKSRVEMSFTSQPNFRYSGFCQSLCNAIQKTAPDVMA